MPKVRSAKSSRSPSSLPLRRYVRPRNMDRVLAALYEVFQVSGSAWISVETLLMNIEDQAREYDDTLGKKFALYCRSCLSALRRNSYVEYKILDLSDEVRITDYTKEIFENLRDLIPTFSHETDGDLYRLKCDLFRIKVQPKSRRLPTRAELDRENIVLGVKNRELIKENHELESELNLLKQDLPGSCARSPQQSVQGLQRTATEPEMGQLESGFTDSMYIDPVPREEGFSIIHQGQGSTVLQNTPIRPSAVPSDVAARSYPTPVSAPRNGLARRDSQLLSPPDSPQSSPTYVMPGAFEMLSSGETIMETDDDVAGSRPSGFEVDDHGTTAVLPFGLTPVQSPSPDRLPFAFHQDQIDPILVSNTACRDCDMKTKVIESQENLISELHGEIKDHKTFIGHLQDMVLEKIKKIRQLTNGN